MGESVGRKTIPLCACLKTEVHGNITQSSPDKAVFQNEDFQCWHTQVGDILMLDILPLQQRLSGVLTVDSSYLAP